MPDFKISPFFRLLAILLLGPLLARADTLEQTFRTPPASARPWVFWYWFQGAVSREGITADLTAMKEAGLGGAYLMSINGPANPPLYSPVLKQLTPEWWAMVKFAATEADRLGLKLGMNVCDGFATAGGPWITPELSAQKIVWSETIVDNGQALNLTLPQPPTNENHYRDIAVVAFPTLEQDRQQSGTESLKSEVERADPSALSSTNTQTSALGSMRSTLRDSATAEAHLLNPQRSALHFQLPPPRPKITTSLAGFDAQFLAAGLPAEALAKAGDGKQQFRSDGPCWIQYEYAAPFTLRSLVLRQWEKNYGGIYHATRLKIEASDDGITFRPIVRLDPPRHGWQDWDADLTFSITPVTARFFRFVHDPVGAEAGSEDLDGAKWKPRLVLRGLELSSVPRLSGFEGKSGAVWRQSAVTIAEQLPDALCIPRDRIIDLTSHLAPDGRLNWTPPTTRSSRSPNPKLERADPSALDAPNAQASALGSMRSTPENDLPAADPSLNAQLKSLSSSRWTILRIGHTSTGHRNETGGAGRGLECDKFNPVAVRAQFEGWFGEAIRQLGPDLAGRVLKVFHVDSWETGSQNWSPVFKQEFERRRGHAPDFSYLPVFAGVPIGSAADSEKFLADVRQTISDLTTENFFGTLAALAHEHASEFSAESTAPTMMGDGLRHYGIVDLPMGEFWLRSPTHDKPNDIHDAISGAHIYGKNIVQAEAFTELRLQWDEHPGMLKSLADHEFALGINRFAFHVFAHNPWPDRKPGMTLNGVGLYFQRDQTWWRDAGAWTDYISRCSALLQQGRPVADVAYFIGEDLPSRAILPERRSPTLPPGYAADSINADALLQLAQVKDGRLILPGGASYAALVLPEHAAPSPALAEKIRELEQSGVSVTSTDLIGALTKKNVLPDLLTAAEKIEWTHRSSPEAEIYFISNQQNTARTIEISLRSGARPPEIWQPVTGEINFVQAFDRKDGRTMLEVPLDPHGSVFVVLRTAAEVERAEPSALGPRSDQSNALGSMRSTLQTLDGPWQVAFDAAFGGPPTPIPFAALTDWSAHVDPRIRYYSGSASYTRTFTSTAKTGRMWLDLGDVANLAHVWLNGIDCGVAWTPPYRVEVTPALLAGENNMEIRVTNTWSNRLLGDRLAPAGSTPLTWTNAPAREGAKLLPAGLFGPVKLLGSE